ncbi:arylsulfatase F [Talpa occidentalis]|uniref:arylsulfatase F n=1 Tax=Talpa occidentalis TaxID=50954 RepID=UPI0023F8F637|nr:arylsulfatase F [Talpa occidentalis]
MSGAPSCWSPTHPGFFCNPSKDGSRLGTLAFVVFRRSKGAEGTRVQQELGLEILVVPRLVGHGPGGLARHRLSINGTRHLHAVRVFCYMTLPGYRLMSDLSGQLSGAWERGMELRSLWLSLCALGALLPTCRSQGAGDERPNIVLFMVDDLGIGDLGCFGNDTIRTPHVDRLAREGVRLTQHIAAASLCTPSRSAFLTGRYPIRSGMVSSNQNRVILHVSVQAGLPRNETTFAQLLRAQGYSTALIGKWHQGLNCESRSDHCHHPHNYGFDYFYGTPTTLFDECWPDPSRGTELALSKRLCLCVQLAALAALTLLLVGKWSHCLAVAWPFVLLLVLLIALLSYAWFSSLTSRLYWSCLLMRQHEVTEQPMKAARTGSIMVREALAFLERHREGPFLLFFSFLHVHTPLPTSDEFIGTSQHGLYGDNVQEMDFMLGKILDALDGLNLTQNTLVYFTSDHGGHLEARRGHAQLGGWNGIYKGGKAMGGWEGGIRVPGIVRWPGKVAAGRDIDEPTSLMDILPTLAAVSGATVPQDRVIDGRNLMPLLQGHTNHSEHEFLFHYCGSYLHAARWHPQNSEAVWKVHYVTPVFQPPGAQGCYQTALCQCSNNSVTYHDPPLLFDLSRDPSESNPLRRDTEPLYDLVIQTVTAAVREHRKSITPVRQQLLELNKDIVWLRPCCGMFPFCLCDKEEGSPGVGW